MLIASTAGGSIMEVPSFKVAKAKIVLPPIDRSETGDGDTMRLNLPFRLVSVDTPEKSNVGGKTPTAQKRLEAALAVLQDLEIRNKVPDGFAAYFAPRVTGGAARHYEAAEAATRRLRELRDDHVKAIDGKEGQLAVIPAGEVVDGNGRMLAYVAPYLSKEQREALSVRSKKRQTFNLRLVAEGWAASFPIWPSFPSRRTDFAAFLDAAGAAYRARKGNWAHGNHETLLTGYEFRALIKVGRLAIESASNSRRPTDKDYLGHFSRHCLDRRGVDHGRYGFVDVPHGGRLWAWTPADVRVLTEWIGKAI